MAWYTVNHVLFLWLSLQVETLSGQQPENGGIVLGCKFGAVIGF
ncbi:hypothetical protein VCHA42O253_40002 [Vibrio chagasii]|nr:hypothetical protein VCHA42O253_40002 [Vibrio chagasii]